MEEANQYPFLTVREAGDFLRLKKRTLENLALDGITPAQKLNMKLKKQLAASDLQSDPF